MNIIVCLDDNHGMLFHKRRQSREQKVLEDIFSLTKELWMNSFSEKLFVESDVTSYVDEEFLNKAGNGEFCFVENEKVMPHINRIEQIIVYKWNRKYPADLRFDVPLQDWKLVGQKEFAGKSHEKITKEIYVRG